MKSWSIRFASMLAAVIAAATFVVTDAQAKRLGGGQSVGKQQSGAMQRQATPPSQQAAPSPRQAAPAAAPQPQRNRWLAPLAGLAAGLGLAALASALGFGEELASFMLIALLVVAALVVVKLIMARRAGARQPMQPAWSGASAGGAESGPGAWNQPATPPAAASGNTLFSPMSPGESSSTAGTGAAVAGSSTGLRVPANFDITGFVRNAKVQFMRLQAAFDAGNLNDLREFTSPEMYAELQMQIRERGASANVTEVVSLEAEFLGVDSSDSEHMASVRFYGVIREAVDANAESFDEIWNLTKPTQGSGGWVLAGIQQNPTPE